MHQQEDVDPQDDPEFWDRPADEPPAYRPGGNSRTIYREDGLLFQGVTAINVRTKTLYEYDSATGEWTKNVES